MSVRYSLYFGTYTKETGGGVLNFIIIFKMKTVVIRLEELNTWPFNWRGSTASSNTQLYKIFTCRGLLFFKKKISRETCLYLWRVAHYCVVEDFILLKILLWMQNRESLLEVLLTILKRELQSDKSWHVWLTADHEGIFNNDNRPSTIG